MALLFGEDTRTPLVDSSTSRTVRRRGGELTGLMLLAGAGALALALISYDVSDPSHFSSTPQPPANWLGRPGALVADPMMRIFGVAAWGFVLYLGVWGWRFVSHVGAGRLWLRLPLAPIALILGMVFASLHPPYAGWPLSTGLGGLLGDSGVVAFLEQLPLPPDQAVQALTASIGLALFITASLALGLTASEMLAILRWLFRSLWRLVATVLSGLRQGLSAAGSGVTAGARAARSKPRSERMEPAEPTGSWKRGRTGPAAAEPVTEGEDEVEPESERESRFTLPRLGLPSVGLPRLSGRKGRAEEVVDELPEHRLPGADERRELADAIRNLKEGPPPQPVPAERAEPRVAPAAQKPAKKSRRARSEAQPGLFDGLSQDAEYETPPLALLEKPSPVVREQQSEAALEENARMLETVLEDYGVRGEITAVKAGPVVTLYELEPAPGLKASRVIGLADDIARSMSALAARIATVPGRSVIGIELPNARREKVLLRELFESASFGDSREKLALALGKDIAGAPVVADLARMPHLLIAGTTGSGKSVAINTMILSILYRKSPRECRLIMIDPKMLELSVYDNIPHLLAPVVTDPKKALVALKWVVAEMEDRYRKMSKMGVRNIDGYNARVREALTKGEEFSRTIQTGFDETTGEPVYETETFEPEEMPFIVVIVDEMADLMMVAGKEIEACIQRLAQMARASGIHLIMATQRPSVDVITGTIKANFPTRISFQVTSKIDSRTILGEQGAEQLLGQGDMLYMAGGGRITRVHGPFVSDEEVEEVVGHLKTLGRPDYVGAVTEGGDEEVQALVDEKLGLATSGDSEDELYDKAVAIVARDRKCSTSYIQRKLAIGYNKAARLVEQMEDQGVVSPANAVGKREILIEER